MRCSFSFFFADFPIFLKKVDSGDLLKIMFTFFAANLSSTSRDRRCKSSAFCSSVMRGLEGGIVFARDGRPGGRRRPNLPAGRAASPLATKTDTDGNPLKVPLYLNDTWGLIYTKGQSAKMHNHWPSLWSYTYCVFACENCSPLVFPHAQEPLSVTPKTSQMIVFPSWLQHEVPTHTCDHERIMLSGNLNVDKENAS